jgi:PleD family two-component response regulator
MSKKVNILIGDSSITVRESIKELISVYFENYDILESETGNIVLDDLKVYKNTDIIFLANTFEDMTGERVLSLIRNNDDYNHVRIIMTMSEENKDKLHDLSNLGIFGYLVKPFDENEFSKLAKKYLTFVE